jgi:hypothetical protein
MTIFSQAQAKEHLDTVLAEATTYGEVRIRRGDGQEFVLRPVVVPANGATRRDSVRRNSGT